MSEAHRKGVALITGASGFIGSRLRQALLADGHDVVALTRADSPPPKQGRGAPVDYEQPETLERVLRQERPEVIYHLAGTLTSNIQVALAWAAGGLWEQAGLAANRQEALKMFLPPCCATWRRSRRSGRPTCSALTGR